MSGSPGWYPDPTGRFEHRYHNGTAWTADVAVDGNRYVDPTDRASTAGGDPGAPAGRNGVATAGMVCGIVGLSISWIPFLAYAGLATGAIGLVLSIIGFRRSRTAGRGRPFAVTGIAAGGGAIVLSALGIWLTAIVVDRLDDYVSPEPSDATITSCARRDGGVVVAEGTVRNVGDEPQSYSIVVELRAPGGGRDLERAEVDDLGPGEERRFAAELRPESDGEPTCRIVAVDGPLPFGIDPDRRG